METQVVNDKIKQILSKYKKIAMIGVSNDPTKASTIVMKYMQEYGFKVYPVNPKAKGQKILGEEVFEKITDIKEEVDIVDVFRPSKEALAIAEEQELDLVEISPNASPPVCKVMDYKKFVYEQKKREKSLKSKATKVIIKEIRFGPNTDNHDYEFKKKHAEKFLKDGAKLKAYVFFKGRSIIYKDQGEILLLKLAQELEELGKVEQMPKLEGKRMIMFIAPKKK